MPCSAFLNDPRKYVETAFKNIVTPANIRRMIFFDKNDGSTTLTDRSSNSQNATLSMAASSLDPASAGKARVLNFNAAGDYWEFEDADYLSFGDGTADSAFSIVACISPNIMSANEICSKNDFTTGNTKQEYYFDFFANNLFFGCRDNSANARIARTYTTSIASDIGSFHTYIGTYSGNSNASGIKIYRDGTRVDNADSVTGTYIAMENLGANVGNYRISTGGAKEQIGSYKGAFIAILSIELTQNQITSIDYLLKKYLGVM